MIENFSESIENSDQAMNSFINDFKLCFDNSFTPCRVDNTSHKYHAVWVDQKYLKMSTNKKCLHDLYTRTKKLSDFISYKNIRNKLNNYAKYLKKIYYDKKIETLTKSPSPKKYWNFLSKIMPNKKGKTLTKNNITPENFAHFFSTIAENLINDANFDCFSLNPSSFDYESFHFSSVTVETLMASISHIKHSKTLDIYGINSFLIKKYDYYFAPILTKIFNKIILSGNYPSQLKVAKVVPIYKSGDKHTPSNYRPLSVLPVISKIFEHIMYEQLLKYFDKHDLISPYQNGFRPQYNTTYTFTPLFAQHY